MLETLSRWWFTPRIRSNVITGVLATVMLLAGLVFGSWRRACAGAACPSTASLVDKGYDPQQASKVYAADGRLITDLGLQRRTLVPLSQISPAVVAAFVVTEDKRFYDHHGVDWFRFFGALWANFRHGGVAQGFSTITMQLARNLFPEDISGQDRTIRRKLREVQVAYDIERNFPKDKILEFYLNQIDLGNRAYGVESASQRYFGKSVRDLNVAEAATLAALPKAPSRYNPRKNPDLAVYRRNIILTLMEDAGLLSQPDAERWKSYPLVLSSRSDFSEVAPYFIEYVRQQLDTRFGPDLYTNGLRIYTTIDLDMQQAAERALTQQLDAIESGTYGEYEHPTYSQYIEKREDQSESPVPTPYLQGLAVTLEAKTGAIRAMVGGRDFNDSKFNRATQATRQPGSTFKPFVYAAALRAGYPWSTIMVDDPISVEMRPGEPPWEPANYDNKFEGAMTLREALYKSRNIIAIKLGMEIGPQAVIGEAARFGLTTNIPPYPSIYIGSADVIPLEIISAYSAFATLGTRTTPYAIERVEDRAGNTVWAPKPRSEVVMDSALAWLMVDGMRDVVRRGTAASTVGARFPIAAGGKTGTTNDYTDVWFIGYTPDLVTGLWIGMDKPQKIMGNAQGGRLAAPAWTAMMREIYERRPTPAAWTRPEGLTFVEIDRGTGYKFTPFCPKDSLYVESFIPGTEPKEFCPIHSPFGNSQSNPLQNRP
ncbi:MAG TPA: PBP1A family penicillin-binding protein [Gemmatimonadales bacterium]|nr:PBP1A family penicillin-binding protein [Gemmatimonadales bacterium]